MANIAIRAVSRGTAAAAVRCLCPSASLQRDPPSSAAVATAEEWKPLYRRLSALGGAPEGSVSEALDRWVAEGRRVRPLQLMRHVREFRKYRRHRQALEMLNWMEKNGLEMPSGRHAVQLDLISTVKGVDSAEEYFASLLEPAKNYGTYGALLSCYCKENMTDKAIALYEKMKELNLALNTLAYNNLMSLYMKIGQLEKVLALFQELKSGDICPDNCTYRILMKSYACMNDIESVEKLIQEMEGSQGALDWFTYCHIAAIYNSASLFGKAETAIQKAELVMNSGDLSPFRFLISLYAGAGNLAEVKRVWKLLKDRIPRPYNSTPRPTNVSYLVMLQALKKLGDMDSLKQCFQEWETDCIHYDMKLVNTVIAAYLENDMVEELELLQEKVVEKGAQSDIQTYALFIDYYLKTHDLELAWKCSKAATSLVKRVHIVVTKQTDDKGSGFLLQYGCGYDNEYLDKHFYYLRS